MSESRVRFCQFCLFYVNRNQGGGWCHRYPPSISIRSLNKAIHPIVSANDFCGEYEPMNKQESSIKYKNIK